MNWLTESFINMVNEDPELIDAYEYDDYPNDMTGEGNWIDLYLTESDEHPVGRLWVNPETQNAGVMPLQNSNADHLTRVALELREFAHHEVDATDAYDIIRGYYYAHQQKTGELADADTKVPV
jgi:hypothetical protein